MLLFISLCHSNSETALRPDPRVGQASHAKKEMINRRGALDNQRSSPLILDALVTGQYAPIA
jgi:hypothetical protein